MIHDVRFEGNTIRPNMWRAICTCGWCWYADTLEEVQSRAATHDLEWIEVKPTGGQHGEADNR